MPNPVTWFEIIGENAVALQGFYREVFGWKLSDPMADMGNYSMLDHEEKGIGGGIGEPMGGPNRVTVYIEVDDPQAYLEKIAQKGGMTIMPVTQVTPDVTIAMFTDPAGNTIGLLKSNPG